MQRLPYTLDEAKTLCKNLQHLIGHTFDMNDPNIGNIECIAVTPFDHQNKKIFFLNYLLAGNAQMALSEDYRGFLFDVCIIARAIEDDNDIRHYDINTWSLKNNLQLDELLQVPGISSKFDLDGDNAPYN